MMPISIWCHGKTTGMGWNGGTALLKQSNFADDSSIDA